jgi:hypothetical protein
MAKHATKRDVWLKHYLNDCCPATFINATESAKAAKYKCKDDKSFCSVGNENLRLLEDKISTWLDECGITENRLKIKLLSLLDAKETKFFAHDGIITDQVDVEALGIQRLTLDMGLRVKGLYAKDNAQSRPIIVADLPEEDRAALKQAARLAAENATK